MKILPGFFVEKNTASSGGNFNEDFGQLESTYKTSKP